MFVVMVAWYVGFEGAQEAHSKCEVLGMGDTRAQAARRATEAILHRVIPFNNEGLKSTRAEIRRELARNTPNGDLTAFDKARDTVEKWNLFGPHSSIVVQDLGRLVTVTDNRKIIR